MRTLGRLGRLGRLVRATACAAALAAAGVGVATSPASALAAEPAQSASLGLSSGLFHGPFLGLRTRLPLPALPGHGSPAVPTTTTLTVTPASGEPYQEVTIAVAVEAVRGRAEGVVRVSDGSAQLAVLPVRAGRACLLRTSALGEGEHRLVAQFEGRAGFAGSTSAPVTATYGTPVEPGGGGGFTVVVRIPSGALSITTPYTLTAPLSLGSGRLDQRTSTYAASAELADIVVTDTRAGNLGFTATAVVSDFVASNGRRFSGSYAGLDDLRAIQVPENAMRADLVRLTPTAPGRPGLGSPRVFATYPEGASIGTTHIRGSLRVAGVPTSIKAGLYSARVTFTAF